MLALLHTFRLLDRFQLVEENLYDYMIEEIRSFEHDYFLFNCVKKITIQMMN